MTTKQQQPAKWEWVAAAFGLLLTLFVLGTLGWEAFYVSKSPPRISLRLQRIVPNHSGELAVIEVRNDGSETASDLKVCGTLGKGTNVFEKREVTIDFVPPHSGKSIGLFFSEPVSNYTLTLEPLGYVEP